MRDLTSRETSSGASAISEGDIFIYSCSAQLISFEIESTSKEINCAEHEYMNMSPSRIALAPLLRETNLYPLSKSLGGRLLIFETVSNVINFNRIFINGQRI